MVGLGVVAGVLGLPRAPLEERICAVLSGKGEASQAAALACLTGAWPWPPMFRTSRTWPSPANHRAALEHQRQRSGGAGRAAGGRAFLRGLSHHPRHRRAGLPAPNLPRVGGALVQAEDELASIKMCIGASFGGTPSVTATSGPGLSLMTEALGLAVASETPLVVIDVMRGGPSTGIPTKSEQSDLNIAVYGLHGDAPHLVLAPNGVDDCLLTAQWAVDLAEQLQTQPSSSATSSWARLARCWTVLPRPDSRRPGSGRKPARANTTATRSPPTASPPWRSRGRRTGSTPPTDWSITTRARRPPRPFTTRPSSKNAAASCATTTTASPGRMSKETAKCRHHRGLHHASGSRSPGEGTLERAVRPPGFIAPAVSRQTGGPRLGFGRRGPCPGGRTEP